MRKAGGRKESLMIRIRMAMFGIKYICFTEEQKEDDLTTNALRDTIIEETRPLARRRVADLQKIAGEQERIYYELREMMV